MDRNKERIEAKKRELNLRRIYDGFTDAQQFQNYHKSKRLVEHSRAQIPLIEKHIVFKEKELKEGIVEKDETIKSGIKEAWAVENEIELLKGKIKDIEVEIKVNQAQVDFFETFREPVKDYGK